MKLQISNFASKSLCHVPQPAVSFFSNFVFAVSNSGPSTATADPAEQRIPLFPTDATEVEQQVSIMLKKGVRAPDYLFP